MGVKKNFAYSLILTVSGYIFPLIIFPYVSRVLGVDNIGICSFVDSIINYFILFSMMGISSLGIREIASQKNNRDELDKCFSSLVILNGVFTLIAAIVLIALIYLVPKFFLYKELLWMGVIKLLFNFLLIEWLFKGLEEFKYITIRSLIIKILYAISVFLFVKESSDYPIYYFLSVAMVVINSVVNYTYSRKYVSFRIIQARPFLYLRQFLTIGLYLILTSFYTSFNVTYLGMVSTTTQVGYYSTATKIFSVFLSIFSAFTGVMLPNMSHLFSQGRMDDFKEMISKSVRALSSIAIPLIVLSELLTPEIIALLAGKGYEGAIPITRVVLPLIFILGYEQILAIQVLMPMHKDNALLVNSIVGASFGIIMNVVLVKLYQGLGSSLVWLLSEVLIMALLQFWSRRYLSLRFPFKQLLISAIVYLPAFVILLLVCKNVENMFIKSAISCGIMALYFMIVQLFILKDDVFVSSLKLVIDRFSKGGK